MMFQNITPPAKITLETRTLSRDFQKHQLCLQSRLLDTDVNPEDLAGLSHTLPVCNGVPSGAPRVFKNTRTGWTRPQGSTVTSDTATLLKYCAACGRIFASVYTF